MYVCKMNRKRLCKEMGLSYIETIRRSLKFETRLTGKQALSMVLLFTVEPREGR